MLVSAIDHGEVEQAPPFSSSLTKWFTICFSFARSTVKMSSKSLICCRRFCGRSCLEPREISMANASKVEGRRLTLAGRWLFGTNSDHDGCVDGKNPKFGERKEGQKGWKRRNDDINGGPDSETWGSDLPCLIWLRWETRQVTFPWLVTPFAELRRIFKSPKLLQLICLQLLGG